MSDQSFNFEPFERNFVNAPLGAFSSLLGQRLEQFRQGELITDEAKETFGNLEVAQEDQVLRNQIADDLGNTFDTLLDKYEGAYESIQFQRDAKKVIIDASRNPALQAMQSTLSEVKFEEELRREAAKNPSIVLYDFKPEGVRNTSYDPEVGYSPYKTGLETAQGHLKDAQAHMGTLIPNMSEITPQFEIIKGEGMRELLGISQGSWKGITKKRVRSRAEQVVDDFATSINGGNQMARKFAFDNNLGDIHDESGNVKTEVAAFLANYLYNVGADQEHSQINRNYSFPASLNKDTKTKSVFGSSITNTSLFNNPAAAKFQKLKIEDLQEQGLQGDSGRRLAKLRNQHTNSMVVEGITLSQKEFDELNKLEKIQKRVLESDGLTSYISSFQKIDGSFDIVALDDTHKGLFRAYESVLTDNGMTIQDAIGGGIEPTLFNSLDNAVLQRYDFFVDNNLVAVGKGYNLSENDVEEFERNFIGDIASAGLGRITNMGFIDEEGTDTNINEIAENSGFDLTSPKSAREFKTTIQLVQNLIPLVSNGIAQVNIAGKSYILTSDEHTKAMKASALSQAGPVILGEVEQSKDVMLPFMINPLTKKPMIGRFTANHKWNPETNEYIGNGVGFITQDPQNPSGNVFYPLEGVVLKFLETNNFYAK